MQNQYVTLSLSTIAAMGLFDKDPLFLKQGTRYQQEIREICWHALFLKPPQQLQEWLEATDNNGLRQQYQWHLNECRAWFWLTLYNRHFINLQLNAMNKAEREEMVSHLNRLREQHKQFQQRHPQPERAKP